MEVATEDHSGLIGACDRDYGCIYMNTLSWRTPTTPMPMEINPRKVFERMFGQGDSEGARLVRRQEDRSILDAVTAQATGLQRELGAHDRQTLDDYLEGVREIERRLTRAESQVAANADLVIPEAPSGVPFEYTDHVRLMYDLLALAYSADITRVFTFMMGREVSNRTYTQVGVTEGHHAVSHHQNKPEKLDMLARIQAFHIGLFGEFLAKLDATPDGDGSLLDNTILLYGSNMSNSNAHDHYPLPNVVVGGGRGRLKGGQHIVARGSCADDQSAPDDARQGRRRRRVARRQHRHDQRALRVKRPALLPHSLARLRRCRRVVATAGAARPCRGSCSRQEPATVRRRWHWRAMPRKWQLPRPTARRRCTGPCDRTTSSSSSACCARAPTSTPPIVMA